MLSFAACLLVNGAARRHKAYRQAMIKAIHSASAENSETFCANILTLQKYIIDVYQDVAPIVSKILHIIYKN